MNLCIDFHFRNRFEERIFDSLQMHVGFKTKIRDKTHGLVDKWIN